ncbi:MAG: N-acetylmuramoyl-L-alanine amidase [Akkermansia sp.]
MPNKILTYGLPLMAMLSTLSPAPLSALEPRTQPWRQVSIAGVDYVSLAEVMAFYDLKLQAQANSALRYANPCTSVVLDEHMPFILMDGVAVKLLHPLRKDGLGEQLIAKQDCIHMLDPILRPHAIRPQWTLRRVVIDPCHGGVFQGVRASERAEKSALVLQLAQMLKARLESQGFEVLLCRRDDYYVNPQERVDLANNTADSMLIQLRLNDYNEQLGGIQSYIAEPSDGRATDGLNAALGMAVQSYLTVGTGFKDDGLRRVKHDMLSGIHVPAVCVALGNMGSPQQRLDLHDKAKQEATVSALQAAINAFAVAVAVPQEATPEPVPEAEATPTPTPEVEEIQAVASLQLERSDE